MPTWIDLAKTSAKALLAPLPWLPFNAFRKGIEEIFPTPPDDASPLLTSPVPMSTNPQQTRSKPTATPRQPPGTPETSALITAIGFCLTR